MLSTLSGPGTNTLCRPVASDVINRLESVWSCNTMFVLSTICAATGALEVPQATHPPAPLPVAARPEPRQRRRVDSSDACCSRSKQKRIGGQGAGFEGSGRVGRGGCSACVPERDCEVPHAARGRDGQRSVRQGAALQQSLSNGVG